MHLTVLCYLTAVSGIGADVAGSRPSPTLIASLLAWIPFLMILAVFFMGLRSMSKAMRNSDQHIALIKVQSEQMVQVLDSLRRIEELLKARPSNQ